MNNVNFTIANNPIADTATFEVPSLLKGVQEGLSHGTTGATVSMLVPSQLAYGQGSIRGDAATVPVNSPLRFEFAIKRVSP
jgi:FKBP-type peptidyl-prolyl cis-trans isomerase FkpA